MTVSRSVTTINGAPAFHYQVKGHAVLTGPIDGEVVTADGTVYDVSPHVIEVAPPHAGEVCHLIGLRYETEGHADHGDPANPNYEPFTHHCTDHCGEFKRDLTDPAQAVAAVRAQQVTDAIGDGKTRDHFAAAMGTGSETTAARASSAAENAALNGLDGTGATNTIPDVSLHVGDTSTTGANENANTGSYARQACTWNAASGGNKTNSTALTFSTAGSVAVTYFGTWSSATYGAGTFAIGGALTSSVTATTISIASGALSLAAS